MGDTFRQHFFEFHRIAMPKILVTGAAGFIGSHTVDRLLRDGHTVTGIDNFRTGRRENLVAAQHASTFTLIEADVAEPGVAEKIAREFQPDAIIHLAALVSVQESLSDPGLNQRLNVDATFLVAEAARRQRVARIVFASSAAIYGDATKMPIRESAEKAPISPYGAAKLASEVILSGHGASYGITVRCQRYFNVFGPRQDPASPYSGVISIFARRYREGKGVTIFGDGRQTRDFISVYDVARANALAATRAGVTSGVANICTGRATSLLEVAAVFAREHPTVPAPRHEPPRPGDIIHSLGAAEAAAAALDFHASVTVQDGLLELIRAG